MKKLDKYILFLNSRYLSSDKDFYLNILKNKTTIAVDGGIRFFLRNRIYPDLLIGDFDSTPQMSKKYLSNFEVVRHPAEKDKTDGQLALEIALRRGGKQIEICGALGATEIDHTLGNIFLLELVNKFKRKLGIKINAYLVSPTQRVFLLDDGTISLSGNKDDYISVIPLTDRVKLDFDGLRFPPPAGSLVFGNSLTLRNQFRREKCRLSISGGKAIVVIVKKKIKR